jgi:hypothetical protein
MISERTFIASTIKIVTPEERTRRRAESALHQCECTECIRRRAFETSQNAAIRAVLTWGEK